MCVNQILRNEDGNIEGKKKQGERGQNVKTGYTTKILNRNMEQWIEIIMIYTKELKI